MTARDERAAALAREIKKSLRLDEEDSAKHERQRPITPTTGETLSRRPHPSPRQQNQSQPHQQLLRPEAPRRITYPHSASQPDDPSPPSRPSLSYQAPRPRTMSPYRSPHTPARSNHLRSHSSGALAPPMARAHSSPTVPSVSSASQYFPSPAVSPRTHPLRSPSLRSISPFQPLLEDVPTAFDSGIQSISEDAELDIRPRSSFDNMPQPFPVHASLNSARILSVRRQRPTSPLHSLSAAASTSLLPPSGSSRSSSGTSSPSVTTGRFHEGYPTLHHYSSASSFSSMPSTPTSTRSRSPSVSSLDTIEDEPDLEWEAIEAERAARLAAAADDDGDGGEKRRGSLDMTGSRTGVGFGFGKRGDSSRKRWSVCGGERRADLDLETIWED